MRRSFRCSSLLVVLGLMLPLSLAAQSTATVNADRVNVRSAPSIDASIVGAFNRGARVTIVEKSDTWTKVSAGATTGWVRSNLLTAGAATDTPAASAASAARPAESGNSPAADSRPAETSSNRMKASAQVPGVGVFDGASKFVGAHVGASAYGSTASFGGSVEFPYSDRIGIGAWADYWSWSEDYTALGSYHWNVSYLALAGTGAYHFPMPSSPKLDPFVGLAVGYFLVNASTDYNGVQISDYGNASRIFFGGFGGVRYLFSNNLAGVARLGFGSAYLTLGVDLKM